MRSIKVWTYALLVHFLGYCLQANGLDEQNVICPQGWMKLHRGCYLFKTEKKKWDDASKYCNSKQGSLIIIESTAEKDAIAAHIKKTFADKDWYSGFKRENGAWNTIVGEPLKFKELGLHFKYANQATRRNFDCGLLHFDGTNLYYANLQCRRKKSFICEYHTITSRPSTTSTTLLMTAEPVTKRSKKTAVPATMTPTTRSQVEVIDLSATQLPPSISTTLSDSDVPVVSTVSKDKSTEKDGDEPVTVRVSRSTSGVGITKISTQRPDSGDDDEETETPEVTSHYETGGKSSSTDRVYSTKPRPPVSVVPVVDKDADVSEEQEEEEKEEGGSKKEDKEKDRREKGVGIGKGRTRTSTPSTTSTATTTARTTQRVIPTPRPTKYDWEEALEEFEGCYIPGGRHSARAQVLAARRLYQDESDHCPAVKVSKFNFPLSGSGETVTVPCGGKRRGVVTFSCGDEPVCWRGQPDVTGCASPRFKALLRKVKIEEEEEEEKVTETAGVTPEVVEPPTVEESINVTAELVEVTEAEEVEMEDIIVTSKVITAVTKKSQKPKAKRSKKQITQIVDNVVKAGSNLMSKKKKAVWKKMSREDKVRSASTLMVAMETATVSMAEEIEEPTTIKQTYENVEMEIQVVDVDDLEEEKKEELVYDSSQSDSTFTIPVATLKDVSKGRLAKAVFMTHYSMADLLGSTKKDSDAHIKDDGLSKGQKETEEVATSSDATSDSAKKGNQPEMEEDAVEEEEDEEEEEGPQLASYILSASLGVDAPLTKLPEPITFSMKHTMEIKVGYEVLCSFWNVSLSNGIGFWSQEGCRVKKTNPTHTTCECDHMTNFAILLDVHDFEASTMHQSALRLVTIIGCIISCMSLLAALFTFQCFASLQGERTSIHKNLAICLLLAEILFVAGVDQAKHQVACSVIAVFLHFFFLAAFSWMFLEGLHIIIMLIQVFDASRSRLPYYYLVGYGLPVVVVGISCIVYFPGYGTERFCWLTTERHFIWAFAGPVALILMVNAIFLTYALTTVCRHADYVFNPKDKTTGSGIRQWILGALALEVLLGLTWMFGYFLLSDAGLTLAYVFTILNSLQGLFIFVFHCLLNKKAQKEYRRVIRIPLSRSSSSAATQSTLTKRHNINSRSNEMNHSNSHKPSFNRGTYQPTTTAKHNSNGDIDI